MNGVPLNAPSDQYRNRCPDVCEIGPARAETGGDGMEPDKKRLIAVGVLAFIGAVLLVATVVLAFTALVALITGIDGLPQELDVRVVSGEDLQNASVIHLTDRDLKQHPALASAIRDAVGMEPSPGSSLPSSPIDRCSRHP